MLSVSFGLLCVKHSMLLILDAVVIALRPLFICNIET